jgi:hypothetical protein
LRPTAKRTLNSIYYTWCANIKEEGDHTVDIRLASSSKGDPAFFEAAHFYIDATHSRRISASRLTTSATRGTLTPMRNKVPRASVD